MTITLGASAALSWSLAGTGSATLAVKLPDGTTLTPALTVTGTAGVYTATLPTTQPGRHVLTWTRTTDRAVDVLDVWAADPRYLVSKADALAIIGNVPATQQDDVLIYSATATYIIEMLAGPVIVASRTLKAHGGGTVIVLPAAPATVSAVTVDGVALASTAYVVDDTAGIVYSTVGGFPAGLPLNVVVTYSVGATTIPANVRLAALELIRHLWTSGRRTGRPGSIDAPGDMVATPFGFAVPRRVVELCSATPQAPGFA